MTTIAVDEFRGVGDVRMVTGGVMMLITVIGFYYPGRNTKADRRCKAGFLGNFWVSPDAHFDNRSEQWVGESCFELGGYIWACAEAAFQALKWWDSHAKDFSKCTGAAAFMLSRKLKKADRTYNGNGSNWAGMHVVLCAKFAPGSAMADMLLKTGSTYLLEHKNRRGKDKIWSDNHDGSGSNWLGLLLMIVRDELRGTESSAWLKYAKVKQGHELWSEWMTMVRTASQALRDALEVEDSSHTDDAARFVKCEMMLANGCTPEDIMRYSSQRSTASAQGSAEGSAQESAPGSAQESAEGSAQGSAPGSAEGSAAGSAQGSAEGSAQGSAAVSAEDSARA